MTNPGSEKVLHLSVGDLALSDKDCHLYRCEKDMYGNWHLINEVFPCSTGSCLILGGLHGPRIYPSDEGWYPILKGDKILAMPAKWLRVHHAP